MTKAVSYLRTSSSVNVGEDKDSHKRQRVKIRGFAKKNAYEVSGEFYDKGISGSLDILTRPEMMKLMVHCESTGIRTIIFENASRLSRNLICQEVGYEYLKNLGFTLISSDSPESFVSENPESVLVRQMLSCIAQFDLSTISQRLKSARVRKKFVNLDKGIFDRKGEGKVAGRKRVSESNPEIVNFVTKLRQAGLSYRKISERIYSDMEVTISYVAVKNLIDEIEPLKKFERNLRRRRKTKNKY